MSQDTPRELEAVTGNGVAPQTPEQIERQIELARSQLAATIDALTIRVSPRQVARRNAERVRQAISDGEGHTGKIKVGAVAAVVVVGVAVLVWRRRSR